MGKCDIDFNPVHYLYLNPELSFTGIFTVENALDYYMVYSNNGFINKMELPEGFDYRVYYLDASDSIVENDFINDDFTELLLETDLERLCIIHYHRYGRSNDIQYRIDPDFNPQMYRTFHKITKACDDGALFLDYYHKKLAGEEAFGTFEDLKMTIESNVMPEFYTNSNAWYFFSGQSVFENKVYFLDEVYFGSSSNGTGNQVITFDASSTFVHDTLFEENVHIKNNLVIDGALTINCTTGYDFGDYPEYAKTQDEAASGMLPEFDDGVKMPGAMFGTEATIFNKPIFFNDTVHFGSNLVSQCVSSVTDNIIANGGLVNLTSDVFFESNIDVSGNLDVSGSVTIGDTLYVDTIVLGKNIVFPCDSNVAMEHPVVDSVLSNMDGLFEIEGGLKLPGAVFTEEANIITKPTYFVGEVTFGNKISGYIKECENRFEELENFLSNVDFREDVRIGGSLELGSNLYAVDIGASNITVGGDIVTDGIIYAKNGFGIPIETVAPSDPVVVNALEMADSYVSAEDGFVVSGAVFDVSCNVFTKPTYFNSDVVFGSKVVAEFFKGAFDHMSLDELGLGEITSLASNFTNGVDISGNMDISGSMHIDGTLYVSETANINTANINTAIVESLMITSNLIIPCDSNVAFMNPRINEVIEDSDKYFSIDEGLRIGGTYFTPSANVITKPTYFTGEVIFGNKISGHMDGAFPETVCHGHGMYDHSNCNSNFLEGMDVSGAVVLDGNILFSETGRIVGGTISGASNISTHGLDVSGNADVCGLLTVGGGIRFPLGQISNGTILESVQETIDRKDEMVSADSGFAAPGAIFDTDKNVITKPTYFMSDVIFGSNLISELITNICPPPQIPDLDKIMDSIDFNQSNFQSNCSFMEDVDISGNLFVDSDLTVRGTLTIEEGFRIPIDTFYESDLVATAVGRADDMVAADSGMVLPGAIFDVSCNVFTKPTYFGDDVVFGGKIATDMFNNTFTALMMGQINDVLNQSNFAVDVDFNSNVNIVGDLNIQGNINASGGGEVMIEDLRVGTITISSNLVIECNEAVALQNSVVRSVLSQGPSLLSIEEGLKVPGAYFSEQANVITKPTYFTGEVIFGNKITGYYPSCDNDNTNVNVDVSAILQQVQDSYGSNVVEFSDFHSNVDFYSNVSIAESLDVGGDVNIDGFLTVKSGFKIPSGALANIDCVVNAYTNSSNLLSADEGFVVPGAIFDVSCNVITNPTYFAGDVIFGNDFAHQSALMEFKKETTFLENVYMHKDLYVGKLYADTIAMDTFQFDITSNVEFGRNVTVNDSLFVHSNLAVNNDMRIDGTLEVNNLIVANFQQLPISALDPQSTQAIVDELFNTDSEDNVFGVQVTSFETGLIFPGGVFGINGSLFTKPTYFTNDVYFGGVLFKEKDNMFSTNLFVEDNLFVGGALSVKSDSVLDGKVTIKGLTEIKNSVNVTNTLTAATVLQTSDMRVKRKITNARGTDVNRFIDTIEVKEFYLNDCYSENSLGKKRRYGVLAQDVQNINQNMVTSSKGYMPNVCKSVFFMNNTTCVVEKHDLEVGDEIKFADANDMNFELFARVNEVVGLNSFRIDEIKDIYSAIKNREIMLYGVNSEDFLSVDMSQLVSVCLHSIKDLRKRVSELESLLAITAPNQTSLTE